MPKESLIIVENILKIFYKISYYSVKLSEHAFKNGLLKYID